MAMFAPANPWLVDTFIVFSSSGLGPKDAPFGSATIASLCGNEAVIAAPGEELTTGHAISRRRNQGRSEHVTDVEAVIVG
jgi:hypothetical protein